MSKQLIDWDKWDNEECEKAWKALTSEYSAMQVMYAVFGGILSGDVEFTGAILNKKAHNSPVHVVDFDFAKPDEVCENWISYKYDVPVSTLKNIADEHVKMQQDPSLHSNIYSEHDLENAAAEFFFRWKHD